MISDAEKLRDEATRQHLSPEQARRLEQIVRQQRGLRCLQDREVATAADLNSEQGDRIADLLAGRIAEQDAMNARHVAAIAEADTRRDQEFTHRLSMNQPVTPEELQFCGQHFRRGDVLRRDFDQVEDGIDDAIYGLLNPVQMFRLQCLFGTQIDVYQAPASRPTSESDPATPPTPPPA